MNKFKLISLFSFIIIFFNNCGNKQITDENSNLIDSLNTDESKVIAVSDTSFQVPSPSEMLSFIKMVGGKSNKNISFLNASSNEKKYTESRLKSLNFGIYCCDLSYCSVFEIGSESLKYFKTVKTLGDEIGISTAIKPELLKRLEKNVGRPDSLATITDEIYFSSFQSLEDSKNATALALVVAGGWIESIFLATNLAVFEEKSPVIERLADQKYTLENLIMFLKKHETEASVSDVVKDFEGLLVEFNKIKEQKIETKKTNNSETLTISGGTQLIMTADNYKTITNTIKLIRNKYTLSN